MFDSEGGKLRSGLDCEGLVEIRVEKYFKKAPAELVNLLQQFQASHRIDSVNIQDSNWQYLVAGHSRHPLVLLPGEERFAEYWFRLVLAMQNKRQVLAVTLPAVDNIAAYTAGFAGLLDSLEMPVIDLLGTSLGGCIAQEFVRRFPHRVRRLVLANSYTPDCKSPRISRLYARINPYLPVMYLRRLKRFHLFRLVTTKGRERPFWRAYNKLLFDQYFSHADKSTLLSPVRALADFSTYRHYHQRDLMDWSGQVLIIESTNDSGSSEHCRARLKLLYPQATIMTLIDAGHTPGYSMPVDFSVLVGSFLDKP